MPLGQGPFWGFGVEPERPSAPDGVPQSRPREVDPRQVDPAAASGGGGEAGSNGHEPLDAAVGKPAPDDALRNVASLRAKLWDSGYRPLAIWSVEADRARGKTEQLGKHPFGNRWQNLARQNPPTDAVVTPDPRALNTGILADGLRPIDLDIDDEATANDCLQIALDMFPGAPVRFRTNSSRRLVLLRAADGEPAKITLVGASHTTEHARKIELLGRGNQFVAFGEHESGTPLQWTDAPGDRTLVALPSATEEDIQRLLDRCAPVIGASKPMQVPGEGHASAEPQADPQRLAQALAAVPNSAAPDWEWWNNLGMACWRATGGTEAGFAIFDDWSRRNPAYDPVKTRARWDHYATSPPTKIGAGSIFHLAAQHGWREPQPEDDPGYIKALEDEAAEQAPEPAAPSIAETPGRKDDDAAERRAIVACTHVWRSEEHDFPCTPLDAGQPHTDGTIHVRVRLWDATETYAPADRLFTKQQIAEMDAPPQPTSGGKDEEPPPLPEPPAAAPPEQPPPPTSEDDYGAQPTTTADDWATPLDLFGEMFSAPKLTRDHVPAALADIVFDTAERFGTDPAAGALGALVASASVISDDWAIQVKQHDWTWTENARLWGALIDEPGGKKTPTLRVYVGPVMRLEMAAREQYAKDMQHYRKELARWKKERDPDPNTEPPHPRRARHIVENTTIEALSEALRGADDDEAKQYAPAKKLLVYQDELAEFFANLDRYSASGGKGHADRGSYLRLRNGGPHVIDRINRGQILIPNWSGCILGGIQPGPIQRIARDSDDDGMLQRLFFCVPDAATDGVDREPDPQAARRYERLIPALRALHPTSVLHGSAPQHVKLHPDARRYADEIRDMVHATAALPDVSRRLKSALGKWEGFYAETTLAFHLIEIVDARHEPDAPVPPLYIVPPATARIAAAYMRDILLPHLWRAERVMFASVQTEHARWVAGYILAKHLDVIHMRDIISAYTALRAPEMAKERENVMLQLELIGWLTPRTPAYAARGVTTWRVNPRVHQLFAARADAERQRRETIKQKLAARARQP